jgi:alcohol dehydrogenase (cytochrome c)
VNFSLKAVDPATGEMKAVRKLDYPNMAGALATAGNLVFLGHYDGTFAAYDAHTLNEMWSFNVGSPIQAPPIINQSISSCTSFLTRGIRHDSLRHEAR